MKKYKPIYYLFLIFFVLIIFKLPSNAYACTWGWDCITNPDQIFSACFTSSSYPDSFPRHTNCGDSSSKFCDTGCDIQTYSSCTVYGCNGCHSRSAQCNTGLSGGLKGYSVSDNTCTDGCGGGTPPPPGDGGSGTACNTCIYNQLDQKTITFLENNGYKPIDPLVNRQCQLDPAKCNGYKNGVCASACGVSGATSCSAPNICGGIGSSSCPAGYTFAYYASSCGATTSACCSPTSTGGTCTDGTYQGYPTCQICVKGQWQTSNGAPLAGIGTFDSYCKCQNGGINTAFCTCMIQNGQSVSGYPACNTTPKCNSGPSCSGTCVAPTNTCSTNNGMHSNCVYTTYSGGGSCTQVSAPNQPCTINNCSTGYTCSAGTCTGTSPWIQTTGGDVHSNENIYTPGGP